MDWIAILWSGFVATTLAMTFFWAGRALNLTTFSPAVQIGCMVTADPRRPITETIGVIATYLVGSTVGPLLYAAILSGWTGPAWVGGLILGGAIWFAISAGLPLFGTISACIRSGVIPRPGPFGIGWGRPTPGIIFAAHMIYGSIVAAILAGF
jgi:hypothetical protein